jgi:uncharacterized membrane protein YedE/YeeE
MANYSNLALLVVWGGFALAFVFGFVANKIHFCTMGAVSDIVNMGSWSRMRMWLLAIAIAIMFASLLQFTGLVDLTQSIYTSPKLNWLSHIVGGLLFGIGMTLGSGCGSKTLIRVGTGNLKSFIVMIVRAVNIGCLGMGAAQNTHLDLRLCYLCCVVVIRFQGPRVPQRNIFCAR